jgi:hypothetical protein
MADRNQSSRSITGLDPVQDVICDRLTVTQTIKMNGDKIELKGTGEVYLRDLPTSQPIESHRVWNDNGVLKITPY